MGQIGWLVDGVTWSYSKGQDHIGPYLSNLENGIVSRISWISMSHRAKNQSSATIQPHLHDYSWPKLGVC